MLAFPSIIMLTVSKLSEIDMKVGSTMTLISSIVTHLSETKGITIQEQIKEGALGRWLPPPPPPPFLKR